jgi:hypothetical protein
LDDFVYGVADRQAYLARQPGLAARLAANAHYSDGVNYGF